MKPTPQGKPGAGFEKPKNNRKQAQIANRLRVLRLIYSRQQYSQRLIVRETQMQASTISNIVSELIDSGLVVEGEARESSRVGPKETILHINPRAAYAVGINFHSFAHEICIYDGDGTLLAEEVYEKEWSNRTLGQLPRQIEALARRAGLTLAQINGVGVSIPGIVNPDKGMVILSRALKLENYPIRDVLQEKLNLPVFVDRNVNFGTYYEQYMNPGEYWDNSGYLLVKLNAMPHLKSPFSLGLGINVNGEIYRGANDAAGELDAVLIPPDLEEVGQRGGVDTVLFFSRLGHLLASAINLLDIGHLVVASDQVSMEHEHFDVLESSLSQSLIPISDRRFSIRFARNGLADLSKGTALWVLHACLESALGGHILSASK
jgi:predicted NBD/HSP70 family sugar kinase